MPLRPLPNGGSAATALLACLAASTAAAHPRALAGDVTALRESPTETDPSLGIGPPCECPADVNCDQIFDLVDITLFAEAFLAGDLSVADIASGPGQCCSGDGVLDLNDIGFFVDNFLMCFP